MNESDLRSDVHYLGSSENKAWKKKKNSGLYGIWNQIYDLHIFLTSIKKVDKIIHLTVHNGVYHAVEKNI